MSWLIHALGLDNPSGQIYLFWSGPGSDIGELAIVGSLLGLLRHKNCHVRRCPRLGRYPVDGTTWTVCRRHHPDQSPTHADVLAAARRNSGH